MAKFPVDAPIREMIRAFERLGFVVVREGNQTSMSRENADGSRTSLAMPDHRTLKGSTLRSILTQTAISREEFFQEYRR